MTSYGKSNWFWFPYSQDLEVFDIPTSVWIALQLSNQPISSPEANCLRQGSRLQLAASKFLCTSSSPGFSPSGVAPAEKSSQPTSLQALVFCLSPSLYSLPQDSSMPSGCVLHIKKIHIPLIA